VANPRIDELRKRLEREPGSRLFAQLAEELRKGGELAEAIRVCREGLQGQPNYPSARMTLGRALFDSGDLPGARAELESVIKGAPDNLLAGRLLGDCLEAQGDRAGALARFRATLALAPGDRQILDRIQALEAGKPAAVEPATIVMPSPVPTAPGPGWPPAPVASLIETTLIDVPTPFASEEPPVEAEPAPLSVTQVETEIFEIDEPYRPEPTVVETAGRLDSFVSPSDEGVRAAAVAFEAEADALAHDAPELFEAELPYEEAPPMMVGSPHPPDATATPSTAPAATEAGPAFELETGSEHFPPAAQPPPEAPAEPAVEAAGEAELNTVTLAELYLSQGVMDKAIEVYRLVLARDPRNERARTRLAEIEALDERVRAEEASVAGPGTGDDPQAARRQAIERTIAKLEGLLSALRRE
jgi:tetratricopeptide (TPR) repeat protein